MHCVNPVEYSVSSVVGVTVKHVSNLCRRSVARVHILTLLLEYFANAIVPMHFERDTWKLIGWRFRTVQKSAEMSYMAVFLIVSPNQWCGQICQRLIFTVEPAMWRRICEAQLYKSEFFYTRHATELVPIFHHSSVVLTFDWVQQRSLLLVMHTSKCEFCYFKALR